MVRCGNLCWPTRPLGCVELVTAPAGYGGGNALVLSGDFVLSSKMGKETTNFVLSGEMGEGNE